MTKDTPMTREDMAVWFKQRGVRNAAHLEELLAEHAGKTENEMDRIYEGMHP